MAKNSAKTNLAVSVRERILNQARQGGSDNNTLLLRYGIERFLARLAASSHRERFVLKGAALYYVWSQERPLSVSRPTRDLDFWSSGSSQVTEMVEVFREILGAPVENDGLVWDLAALRGEAMREDARYSGARIHLLARLDSARIALQIDLGFGDAITPPAREAEFPALLPDFSPPRVRVYPRETVVAEKFEALVSLGMANTRMKDFFDLWTLADFSFDEELLREAINATFARRQTPLPLQTPVALTKAFTQSPAKIAAWKSFRSRNRLNHAPELPEVAARIEAFLMPLVAGAVGPE